MSQHYSTAILLTGAAARISQEVAIIDQLIRLKGLRISPNDTLLSGFSSGSLNLIAINGLINMPEWDSYYKSEILFKFKTSDVYTSAGSLPFDTSPLRAKAISILESLNFSLLSDLPYASFILACKTSLLSSTTYWANSVNLKHAYLKLLDLMMASTAIPLLFPKQNVHCEAGKKSSFPHGNSVFYVDGGTKGTFDNFSSNLGIFVKKNGMFDNMYIISPMREYEVNEFDYELNSIDSLARSAVQKFIGTILQKSFVKFLKKLNGWRYRGKPMAQNIYVCIPDLAKNFPLLSFNEQQQQYQSVYSWAEQHPDKLAIPIREYLS